MKKQQHIEIQGNRQEDEEISLFEMVVDDL